MTASDSQGITEWLQAWSEGDESALDKLVPAVYEELRRLAHRYMSGEKPDHLLQTTALVHEAYIRLVDSKGRRWHDRAHFFAVSAQVMRRILVDFARSRHSQKRGGNARQVQLDEARMLSNDGEVDLVALDEAINALASFDRRKSRVVELRFFGGLSTQEIADVIGVSPNTVLQDWSLAKAWLCRDLRKR